MNISSVEGASLFEALNMITNRGSQKELLLVFDIEAYIRINGYFLSPFSLISIRRGMRLSLKQWEFFEGGWKFKFKEDSEILFRGKFTSLIRGGKIVHIKIDTQKIEYSSHTRYELLLRYFKCLDTFYFMLSETDASFHFLTNPLSLGRGWPFHRHT